MVYEFEAVEGNFDYKRFLRVFDFLLDSGEPNEADTVLLAFVLAECCWRLYVEHGGSKYENAVELVASIRRSAVKIVDVSFPARDSRRVWGN